MKYATRFLAATALAAALAACSSGEGGSTAGGLQTAPLPSASPVADSPVKLGEPYQIGGTTYTPADVADYDEVGYASFYGRELAGRPTANGEIFNPEGISAAHKTLPLPSYVEITALDSGKTILVRVNDRGPFANDRLIDLSAGAARLLGVTGQGVTGVRVRKVNPPESERSALRSGQAPSARMDTPDSLLVVLRDNLSKLPRPQAVAAAPSVAPNVGGAAAPVARSSDGRFIREGGGTASSSSGAATSGRPDGRFVREGQGGPQAATLPAAGGMYVVQVASFSSRSRATSLARQIGANVEASEDGQLFRVRYGPYASEAEAQTGLETARKRGYPGAKVFRQ